MHIDHFVQYMEIINCCPIKIIPDKKLINLTLLLLKEQLSQTIHLATVALENKIKMVGL